MLFPAAVIVLGVAIVSILGPVKRLLLLRSIGLICHHYVTFVIAAAAVMLKTKHVLGVPRCTIYVHMKLRACHDSVVLDGLA